MFLKISRECRAIEEVVKRHEREWLDLEAKPRQDIGRAYELCQACNKELQELDEQLYVPMLEHLYLPTMGGPLAIGLTTLADYDQLKQLWRIYCPCAGGELRQFWLDPSYGGGSPAVFRDADSVLDMCLLLNSVRELRKGFPTHA